MPDGEDISRAGDGRAIHPEDGALLGAIQRANQWLRAIACTLARRGVAFRGDFPERAQQLLDAIAAWPFYKAGQLLFDLLELEDFMLEGEPPALVPTTLDAPALQRLAGLVRRLQRHLDGSIASDDAEPVAAAPAGGHGLRLPAIEAGFYLYEDVVLGIFASVSPMLAGGVRLDGDDDRGPDEPRGAAPAAPDVAITHVQFKGKVPRSQADEYVEITNRGGAPADLSGWCLNAGGPRQDFTFALGTALAPGQVIRVYTNEVHPETGGFSYASARALWNDKGDVARLSDAGGREISRYAYGGRAPA